MTCGQASNRAAGHPRSGGWGVGERARSGQPQRHVRHNGCRWQHVKAPLGRSYSTRERCMLQTAPLTASGSPSRPGKPAALAAPECCVATVLPVRMGHAPGGMRDRNSATGITMDPCDDRNASQRLPRLSATAIGYGALGDLRLTVRHPARTPCQSTTKQAHVADTAIAGP